MDDCSGVRRIVKNSVKVFPSFSSVLPGNANASIGRAIVYGKDCLITIQSYEGGGARNNYLYMRHAGPSGKNLRDLKTTSVLGGKRRQWVVQLYKYLGSEFRPLRRCSIKLNKNLLLIFAH